MASQTQRQPAAAPPRSRRDGWLTFAVVYLFIAGGLNLIWGITALAKKSYFAEDGLVWSNLQVWGWVAILVAVTQVVGALLIRGRHAAGMIIGIVVSMAGTLVNFTSIGAYPVWSCAAIVCSLLVLWAVTVHWETV